jgi:ribonucleotide monophosphatase NagD (HAD superfamily)
LREAGLPLALVTNTISRTRASIAAALSEAGIAVTVADVFARSANAAAYLAAPYPDARCLLLNSGEE